MSKTIHTHQAGPHILVDSEDTDFDFKNSLTLKTAGIQKVSLLCHFSASEAGDALSVMPLGAFESGSREADIWFPIPDYKPTQHLVSLESSSSVAMSVSGTVVSHKDTFPTLFVMASASNGGELLRAKFDFEVGSYKYIQLLYANTNAVAPVASGSVTINAILHTDG